VTVPIGVVATVGLTGVTVIRGAIAGMTVLLGGEISLTGVVATVGLTGVTVTVIKAAIAGMTVFPATIATVPIVATRNLLMGTEIVVLMAIALDPILKTITAFPRRPHPPQSKTRTMKKMKIMT
jgi:hypothetical protein